MTDNIFQRLYFSGLVLPNTYDKCLALCHYTNENTLDDEELNTRRKFCPHLFQNCTNVINTEKDYYLNQFFKEELQREFPDVDFDTFEDIQKFANNTTFYPVTSCEYFTKDDILGNEYSEFDIESIYLRICPGKSMLEFQVYSIDELQATFLEYYDFIDPHSRTNEHFNDLEIKRLYKLLNDIHKDNEKAACFIDVIETIYSGMLKRSKLIEEMTIFCAENHSIAREFFTDLLNIGLKMRGWTGEGEYPLKSMDTVKIVDYDSVQDEIIIFYNNLNDLAELPIFIYRDYNFIMSIDSKRGYTIKDRLRIIFDNATQNACIRLSSNWLLATSWYYMDRYFNEQIFEKKDLDNIS
jgi:hypothetical protein